MKIILSNILIVFIFCLVIYSKPSTNFSISNDIKYNLSKTDTCENANSKAKKDFQNSKYTLHTPENQPVQNTYFHILKDSFQIKRRFINIEDTLYYKCYDSVMTTYLKSRYGKKFLSETKVIADSLEQTKNWITDPKYEGGYKEFKNKLREKIKSKNLPTNKILINLTINSNGKIIHSNIRGDLDSKLTNEIKNIIENMGDWEPGFQFGKPTEKSINIPIDLNE